MDNMLYIIAGLVIILMIAVWVLRKNKAQKPPVSPRTQTGNKDNGATLAAKAQQETPTQNAAGGVTSSTTKFDKLTVAQRFMDQQRYDKAIETLERGLLEKPHDNQLSLKLLNVYALTNQQEDFNSTYAAINTHSDAATIEQAQQLKDLLDAEQDQVSDVLPENNDKPSDFESLDFDVSTKQTSDSNNNTDLHTPTSDVDDNLEQVEQHSRPNASSNNGLTDLDSDTFDLTLDDLETADLEQDILEDNSTDTLEDPSTSAAESDAKAAVLNSDTFNNVNDTNNVDDASNVNNSSVDNNDDDFTLDFDLLSDDTSGDLTEDSEENDLTLSDEDFVLDFDELAEETDADTEKHAAATSEDSIDDDFTLFIDEPDHDTVAADDATINAPTTQDSSQDPSLERDVLESSVDDTLTPLETLSLEDEPTDNADFIDLDMNPDEKASTPTFDDNTLTFDDETVIDDFHIDTTDTSPTTMTPVTAESDSLSFDNSLDNQDKDTLPSADFAAQFAADFDFVKTLDNHQVTLDLAGQYLHLGEYDSAKRLLNEVMAQGNSDQQQQAQELLARTA